MSDLKKLRITQNGLENLSGPIGMYNFTNGVSDEPIPTFQRDRLAAAYVMVEINEDGSETPAGAAYRLATNRLATVAATKPLHRQTEEERDEARIAQILSGERIRTLYSQDNLESVASEGGISAIRKIADTWGVKSKSIPDLIEKIVNAQSEYVKSRTDNLVKMGVDAEKVSKLFQQNEADTDTNDKNTEAAITGDLSAAITTE